MLIKFRLTNTDIHPVVANFHLSLHRQTPQGEEVIQCASPRHVLYDANMKKIDVSNGVRVEGRQQLPFYSGLFALLLIPEEIEQQLSPYHFLRLTMRAMGQSDLLTDFYPHYWTDDPYSKSYVTLGLNTDLLLSPDKPEPIIRRLLSKIPARFRVHKLLK